jgi:hypothetical protein
MAAKSYINAVITDIRNLQKIQMDSRMRNRMDWWIGNLKTGVEIYDEELLEAKHLGSRNPDFDGDWVGRPDDDFKD